MKHKLLPILIIIPLVFLVIFLSIGNLKMYYKRQNIKVEFEYFKNQANQIAQQKEMLEARILESQMPEHLERIAREDLNLQKIGEKVVAFPITNDNSTTSVTQPSASQATGFWKGFFNFFK